MRPVQHRATGRALALVTSLTLLGALGACSSDGAEHGGGHDTAASAGASVSPRQGDIVFAQGMIPHHEQAVEMADIALAHDSVSADVKRLATDVKAAQDPEIQQMQGWLSSWGAPATATGSADPHAAHGMMTDEDMDALEDATGDEFNRMWMAMMIEHHDGAITMAQDVLKTTDDPEVKALAEAVIAAQQAEIEEMKKLLG